MRDLEEVEAGAFGKVLERVGADAWQDVFDIDEEGDEAVGFTDVAL